MIEEQYNKTATKAETIEMPHKLTLMRLGIAVVLFCTALFFKFSFHIEFALFFISYMIAGGDVIFNAARNIFKGKVFDENFLMSIATIGAFTIGEFPEGAAVMLFYQIGEMLQDIAVNRSKRSIEALMNIRPDYANIKIGNDIKRVDPEQVKVGETIVIKPGEKVPLDGRVLEGMSMLDTSAVTGESLPREVGPGSDVISGFINKNGFLTVKVIKEFSESTVSKILDLVQNASSKKAPAENFITKFARYYTPAVVITALMLAVIPPLIVPNAALSEWVYRALIFLVISCPCALVISIPLAFFAGIGKASKNGILVKGSNYLDALSSIDTIVFDKTGTLTKGIFKVTKIHPNGISQQKLLEYAAIAQSYSNHPIAVSILKAHGKKIDKSSIESYNEIPGHGIELKAGGQKILAGNDKLMKIKNIVFKNVKVVGTVVHIAIDRNYSGYIVISDEVKDDSADAVKQLKRMGIRKLIMLTGDNKLSGEIISDKLGLDEVYTQLLPHEKVEKLEQLYRQKPPGKKLVFVGDGINDAPVLTRADIGVAMGTLGSDAAIEAADIVLMTDEPSRLTDAIKISRRTRTIVWQNITFALAVKGFVLLLGALGIATMWEAVFADVGVAILAVLNAVRQ